jgi:hypothetical protein
MNWARLLAGLERLPDEPRWHSHTESFLNLSQTPKRPRSPLRSRAGALRQVTQGFEGPSLNRQPAVVPFVAPFEGMTASKQGLAQPVAGEGPTLLCVKRTASTTSLGFEWLLSGLRPLRITTLRALPFYHVGQVVGKAMQAGLDC